jgi:hypothetical protein
MLNYTARRNDVLTLAHELGHGVHFALAARQGVFHHGTPLTLAETAERVRRGARSSRGCSSCGDAGVAPGLLADRSRARSPRSSARSR